jgi:hypothetical protein
MKYISHSTKASTYSLRIVPVVARISLYITGMTGSPSCRCGAEQKTSDHVLCEFEALATLIHTFLGSFFLYPDDLESLNLEAVWNWTGLP